VGVSQGQELVGCVSCFLRRLSLCAAATHTHIATPAANKGLRALGVVGLPPLPWLPSMFESVPVNVAISG